MTATATTAREGKEIEDTGRRDERRWEWRGLSFDEISS